ncbi:MAG: YifB family Mg chelatase-like AAA ATPase, partial [Streptosporangiaceae bacterium]
MSISSSLPVPGTGHAHGAAVIGVEGHLVQACARISNGPPAVNLSGLPETSTRETRDRIRAAILNSALPWPGRGITVSLLPASLPKRGSGFDLAIAVAVLTAAGTVPAAGDGCVFVAGLGLDGSLRTVPGVLPALRAAAAAGCTRAVVAAPNAAEAVTVPGLAVVPCHFLQEVLAWLRTQPFPPLPAGPADESVVPSADVPPVPALAGLGVPPLTRLALEVAAAGGHHLCVTGPPGAAIPALAAGLTALLPPLDPGEAVEVTAIHSVAGLLASRRPLITCPPLRAPHHTVTLVGLAGGGAGIIRPGEAALAHRGVLFLQDAPEFAAGALRMLRQPLHHGEVTIARGGSTVVFPASFILVAGMAPCPCGAQPGCTCTPLQARRYRARFTGQLGSYIAIWLHAASPGKAGPRSAEAGGGEDADVVTAARVAAARRRARCRLDGTPWRASADIPGAELRRRYQPTAEALAPISRAVDLGEISPRAADQVVRVAWTLADLAGEARPGAQECGLALAFQ